MLYAVPIDTRRGFSAGKPERLFDRVATGLRVTTYTPALDGRRFFTFHSSADAGARTAVALDLGFARRLGAGAAGSGRAP